MESLEEEQKERKLSKKLKWRKKENGVSGENLGIYIKEIPTNYRLIISRRVVGKVFNPWEFTQKVSNYLPTRS